MKKILVISLMSVSYNMMSQVGVYKKEPKASMEIKYNPTATLPNGLLFPG